MFEYGHVNSESRFLIIVNSPYQALCALEAVSYFKLTNFIFAACVSGDPRDSQLFCFLNMRNVEYFVYDFGKKNKVLELVKTIFNFSNKNYECCILCDCANTWNKIVALKFLHVNSIVIFSDDGNNTMSYLRGMTNKDKSIKSIIQNTLVNVSSMVNGITFSKIFFTLYSDIALPKFRCYLNTFASLYKKIDDSYIHKNVYIVGTNISVFCQKLNISINDYSIYLSDLLHYIKKNHINEEIIYIPHGRDKLSIASRICIEKNVKFVPVDTTIELYILNQKVYPNAIYGYTSTSLLNFKKMFPNTKVYNVCCHNINKNSCKEEYDFFSDYFEKHGIKRINQVEI